MSTRKLFLGGALLALAVALAALWPRSRPTSSAGASSMPAARGAGFPLVLELADGTLLTITVPPRRILPANAGIVDFLSLLVEPGRVVAVPRASDGYSRLGAAAAGWGSLPRFGTYAGETVLALEPDLVLTHAWQKPETTAVLRKSGIGVLTLPTPRSWDQVLDTLRLLGRIVGAEERAAAHEHELGERVARLSDRARLHEPVRALSYANFGAGGATAGSGTTLDIVFALAGVENAAAAAGIDGYATLDHERLLAVDPDVIVVDEDPEEPGTSTARAYLDAQPELASLAALRSGRVVLLPAELFSSVSTELVRAAEALHGALGW